MLDSTLPPQPPTSSGQFSSSNRSSDGPTSHRPEPPLPTFGPGFVPRDLNDVNAPLFLATLPTSSILSTPYPATLELGGGSSGSGNGSGSGSSSSSNGSSSHGNHIGLGLGSVLGNGGAVAGGAGGSSSQSTDFPQSNVILPWQEQQDDLFRDVHSQMYYFPGGPRNTAVPSECGTTITDSGYANQRFHFEDSRSIYDYNPSREHEAAGISQSINDFNFRDPAAAAAAAAAANAKIMSSSSSTVNTTPNSTSSYANPQAHLLPSTTFSSTLPATTTNFHPIDNYTMSGGDHSLQALGQPSHSAYTHVSPPIHSDSSSSPLPLSFPNQVTSADVASSHPDQASNAVAGALPQDDPNNTTMSSSLPTGSGEEYYCPPCKKLCKSKSEMNKHCQRHMKSYYCDVAGCTREQGFSTKNDLDRHKHTVHDDLFTDGKHYLCTLGPCATKEKYWPRPDNFRAHLRRIHKIETHTDDSIEEYFVDAETYRVAMERKRLATSDDTSGNSTRVKRSKSTSSRKQGSNTSPDSKLEDSKQEEEDTSVENVTTTSTTLEPSHDDQKQDNTSKSRESNATIAERASSRDVPQTSSASTSASSAASPETFDPSSTSPPTASSLLGNSAELMPNTTATSPSNSPPSMPTVPDKLTTASFPPLPPSDAKWKVSGSGSPSTVGAENSTGKKTARSRSIKSRTSSGTNRNQQPSITSVTDGSPSATTKTTASPQQASSVNHTSLGPAGSTNFPLPTSTATVTTNATTSTTTTSSPYNTQMLPATMLANPMAMPFSTPEIGSISTFDNQTSTLTFTSPSRFTRVNGPASLTPTDQWNGAANNGGASVSSSDMTNMATMHQPSSSSHSSMSMLPPPLAGSYITSRTSSLLSHPVSSVTSDLATMNGSIRSKSTPTSSAYEATSPAQPFPLTTNLSHMSHLDFQAYQMTPTDPLSAFPHGNHAFTMLSAPYPLSATSPAHHAFPQQPLYSPMAGSQLSSDPNPLMPSHMDASVGPNLESYRNSNLYSNPPSIVYSALDPEAGHLASAAVFSQTLTDAKSEIVAGAGAGAGTGTRSFYTQSISDIEDEERAVEFLSAFSSTVLEKSLKRKRSGFDARLSGRFGAGVGGGSEGSSDSATKSMGGRCELCLLGQAHEICL